MQRTSGLRLSRGALQVVRRTKETRETEAFLPVVAIQPFHATVQAESKGTNRPKVWADVGRNDKVFESGVTWMEYLSHDCPV